MRRGPNWLTAIENTSSVTEKIRASTVLTAPRIPPRIARASSTFPTESQAWSAMRPELANASSVSVTANKTRAADAIANGTGSKLVPGTTLPIRTNRLAPIMGLPPQSGSPAAWQSPADHKELPDQRRDDPKILRIASQEHGRPL